MPSRYHSGAVFRIDKAVGRCHCKVEHDGRCAEVLFDDRVDDDDDDDYDDDDDDDDADTNPNS